MPAGTRATMRFATLLLRWPLLATSGASAGRWVSALCLRSSARPIRWGRRPVIDCAVVDRLLGKPIEQLIGVVLLLQCLLQESQGLTMSLSSCPGDQRAISSDFVMLHSLCIRNDCCITDLLVADLIHHLLSLADQAFSCLADLALRPVLLHDPKNGFETLNLLLCLPQMGFECPAQIAVRSPAGETRQCFCVLFFGLISVAGQMHEEIIERFNCQVSAPGAFARRNSDQRSEFKSVPKRRNESNACE